MGHQVAMLSELPIINGVLPEPPSQTALNHQIELEHRVYQFSTSV